MKNSALIALHGLLGIAAAGMMSCGMASVANATTTIIGSETSTDGFTGNLFGTGVFPEYQVASDGEAAFQPFGATFDVSDGLNFSSVGFTWSQATDSFWTEIASQTWVLPADLSSFGCGSENEPTCEPVGHFTSTATWVNDLIGTWVILDENGAISDQIVTFNDANGANVLFYSDPSLLPIPAAFPLFASGVGVMGLLARRRKRKVAATLAAA